MVLELKLAAVGAGAALLAFVAVLVLGSLPHWTLRTRLNTVLCWLIIALLAVATFTSLAAFTIAAVLA